MKTGIIILLFAFLAVILTAMIIATIGALTGLIRKD